MADQNTIGGTSNGSNIVATNGNAFLEALSNIANVGTTGLDMFGSFKERLQSLNIIREEQVGKPQQAVPYEIAETPLAWYSDPMRVQQAVLYTGIGLSGILALYFLMRK